MCVHFQVEPNDEEIAWVKAAFDGIEVLPDIETMREHVWPKYPARVLRLVEGKKTLEALRWGIRPFYAVDKPVYLHNARDDGLLAKPAWKQSARYRRCLVPAIAYFEPGLGPVKARGEVRFTLANRRRFYFAGLWDTDPDDAKAHAFTIVTTSPNTTASRYHDRMPVVLSDTDAKQWIGDQPLADGDMLNLCRGATAESLLPEELAAVPRTTTAIRKQDLKSQD